MRLIFTVPIRLEFCTEFPLQTLMLIAFTVMVTALLLRRTLGSKSFSFLHLTAWMTTGGNVDPGNSREQTHMWRLPHSQPSVDGLTPKCRSAGVSESRARDYIAKPASVMIAVSFLLFSIFISNAFSSELSSTLTLREGSEKIKSWVDLANKFKNTKVLVWKDTVVDHMLRVSCFCHWIAISSSSYTQYLLLRIHSPFTVHFQRRSAENFQESAERWHPGWPH